jgi:hypothetical protein
VKEMEIITVAEQIRRSELIVKYLNEKNKIDKDNLSPEKWNLISIEAFVIFNKLNYGLIIYKRGDISTLIYIWEQFPNLNNKKYTSHEQIEEKYSKHFNYNLNFNFKIIDESGTEIC